MMLNLLRANRSNPRLPYHIAFLEDGPMVQKVTDLGYHVEVFQAGRLRQVDRYVRTVASLKNWYVRNEIDVVLSWASKAHLYAGVAALFAGIPSTWYVHSLPTGTWLERLISAVPADLVLCCGASAAEHQRKIWPHRETKVAYIAVDLEDFNPEVLPPPKELRTQLGLASDRTHIGMVARLQCWKGVHIFIEAANLLVEQGYDFRFTVVGGEHWDEPEYPKMLEEQIQSKRLEDHVSLVGHQDNVPQWMQAMDVLVHASDNEPTGTVIIEAMALGKPVVAARTSGPMEFVTEKVNGFLADPLDPKELSEKIILALTGDVSIGNIVSNARRTAAEFTKERLAARVGSSLREVAESPLS